MKIASLYSSLRGQDRSYPVFDWDFIRALLRDSEEIVDLHVFLPLDCHPPGRFPDVPNVFIHSVMELSEFFQENTVDVWHDFGYTDVSHLTHIRRLSRHKFPITVAVHPWRLALESIDIFRELADYDALLCSKPSTHSIVRSAIQPSEMCSLSGLSP